MCYNSVTGKYIWSKCYVWGAPGIQDLIFCLPCNAYICRLIKIFIWFRDVTVENTALLVSCTAVFLKDTKHLITCSLIQFTIQTNFQIWTNGKKHMRKTSSPPLSSLWPSIRRGPSNNGPRYSVYHATVHTLCSMEWKDTLWCSFITLRRSSAGWGYIVTRGDLTGHRLDTDEGWLDTRRHPWIHSLIHSFDTLHHPCNWITVIRPHLRIQHLIHGCFKGTYSRFVIDPGSKS